MVSETKAKRYFIISYQLVQWFLWYIPLRTFWYFRVDKPNSVDLTTRPLLIVSNHKKALDPWFITCSLPLLQYIKLLPIRFIGTRSPRHWFLRAIYTFIIYPFIYWPNGVIILPPRSKDKEMTIHDKVSGALDCLKKGDVVILFAEGKVNHTSGVNEFKRGPGYLQKHSGAHILLCSIRFTGLWWLFWNKRIVNWHKQLVQIPHQLLDNEKAAPEWLRVKVEELYERV